MTEFEEIKKRKMEELKKQQTQQQAEVEAEQKLDAIARKTLTEDAKARLGNVKLVNQEAYLNAIQAIVYLFNSGQVQGKIDDAQLKVLLKKITGKKEMIIRRK